MDKKISSNNCKTFTGPIRKVVRVEKSSTVSFDVIASTKVKEDSGLDSFKIQVYSNLQSDDTNMNVAVRLQADNFINNEIYTDLNGLHFHKRSRLDFKKVPIQGQFYPMSAGAYIENISNNPKYSFFGITTQQPLGVGNLVNGQFDIILDRRLSNDDYRGLGQGITDNRFTILNFNVHLAKNPENVKVDVVETIDDFETLMMRSSFKILRPKIKLLTDKPPTILSKSFLTKESKLQNCNLEIASVMLPIHFDDFETEFENKSINKIQILTKSYSTRSNCPNTLCKYKNLQFKDIFNSSKFKLTPSNLMGKSLNKLSDTAPIQSFVIESG